jgi:hypothetical protein
VIFEQEYPPGRMGLSVFIFFCCNRCLTTAERKSSPRLAFRLFVLTLMFFASQPLKIFEINPALVAIGVEHPALLLTQRLNRRRLIGIGRDALARSIVDGVRSGGGATLDRSLSWTGDMVDAIVDNQFPGTSPAFSYGAQTQRFA